VDDLSGRLASTTRRVRRALYPVPDPQLPVIALADANAKSGMDHARALGLVRDIESLYYWHAYWQPPDYCYQAGALS
jgi:hypothetical protein